MGTSLPGYRIEEQIGTGAGSKIFAARELDTGKTVAVKHIVALLSAFQYSPFIMNGGTGKTIELTETGTDATHAVKWVICYVPLEENSSIVAA